MERAVGRPKVYSEQDEPLQRVSARLPHWHIRQAKKLGDGNISKGIRDALEASIHQSKES